MEQDHLVMDVPAGVWDPAEDLAPQRVSALAFGEDVVSDAALAAVMDSMAAMAYVVHIATMDPGICLRIQLTNIPKKRCWR